MRFIPLLPLLMATTATAENVACPCVNTTSLFATLRDESFGRPNCTLYSQSKGVANTPICLPSDYGSSGCAAYDANVNGWCQGTSGWCGLTWCYVDHDTCLMSNLDMAGTKMFPALDGQLYYSYGTCGSDPQPYNAAISLGAVRGGTLQVSVPAMYPPAHYKRTSDGVICSYADTSHAAFESGLEQAALSECDRLLYDATVPWEGYVVEFLQGVATAGQFTLELRLASTAARWTHPESEWTAAVRDVQYGLGDLGGGVFWVTPARSGMAAFSTELGADPMWLWVPRPSKDMRLSTLAFRMFEPFSAGLWLTMVLVALAMSVVQAYVFQDEWREDGYDEWRVATGPLQKLGVVIWQGGSLFARSGLDFMLGGIEEYPRTTPKMIVTLGWSFFILISLSAYTANLAAFLTKQDGFSSYIGSMEQAATSRARVCVADAIYDQVAALYPRNTLVRAVNPGLDALVRSGGCDAFLESLTAAQLGERDVHRLVCDMNHVAVVLVLTVQQALPATAEVAPVLTNLIQKQRLESGRDLETYVAPFKYGTCPDDTVVADASGRRRLKAAAAKGENAGGVSQGGPSGGGGPGSPFLLSENQVPSATTPLTPTELLGPLSVWVLGGLLAVLATMVSLYREHGWVGVCGKPGWPKVDLSDRALEDAFKRHDADNSGAWSGAELEQYIKKVHKDKLGPDAIKAMMAEADVDGDGEVDLEEFKRVMRGAPKAAKEQIQMMNELALDECLAHGAESLTEHKKTSLLLQELVTIKHMLQAQAGRSPDESHESQEEKPINVSAVRVRDTRDQRTSASQGGSIRRSRTLPVRADMELQAFKP